LSRFGDDAFFVSWSGRSAIGNTTTGNTVNVRANAAAVTGGRSMGAASNNIVNLGNVTVSSVTGGEGATTARRTPCSSSRTSAAAARTSRT